MIVIPEVKPIDTDDLPAILLEIITNERGEGAARRADGACQALEDLRAVIWETPDSQEISDGLISYLSALSFIERAVSVEDPNWSVTLDLEKVRALYSLGICHANLGKQIHQAHLEKPNFIEKAIRHFSFSASAFRLASSLLQIPSNAEYFDATVDLTISAGSFDCYENLMLGVSQYFRYLSINAHEVEAHYVLKGGFAAGAARYHTFAAKKGAVLTSTDRAEIGAPAEALAQYFTALSELASGKHYESEYMVSEYLTRLRTSRIALDRSYVSASRLLNPEPVKRELLDKIALLDGDLFKLTSIAEEQYPQFEAVRSIPGVDPSLEEMRDIETIINDKPVSNKLQSLVEVCPPNGVRHERAVAPILEFGLEESHPTTSAKLEYTQKPLMPQKMNYSSIQSSYPKAEMNDTVVNVEDSFISDDDDDDAYLTIPADGHGTRILVVLTVLFFLRLLLI